MQHGKLRGNRLLRLFISTVLCSIFLLALPPAVGATEAPNWPDECPLCGGGACQLVNPVPNPDGAGTTQHFYDYSTGTVAHVMTSPEADENTAFNEDTGDGGLEEKPPPNPWVPTDENNTGNENTGGGTIAPPQNSAAGQPRQGTAGPQTQAGAGGLDGLVTEGKGFLGYIGSFITQGDLFGIRVSTILIAVGVLVVAFTALRLTVRALRKKRAKSGKSSGKS